MTNLVERSELERLLAIYRPYLRMIARQSVPSYLRTRFDCSDLVQVTLTRGFLKLDQFKGSTEAEFRSWIVQILRRELLVVLRFHSATKRDIRLESSAPVELISADPTPSENSLKLEETRRLSDLLSQLPSTQKLVVIWRSEGATFVDIANRLDCSQDSARLIWGESDSSSSETHQA